MDQYTANVVITIIIVVGLLIGTGGILALIKYEYAKGRGE